MTVFDHLLLSKTPPGSDDGAGLGIHEVTARLGGAADLSALQLEAIALASERAGAASAVVKLVDEKRRTIRVSAAMRYGNLVPADCSDPFARLREPHPLNQFQGAAALLAHRHNLYSIHDIGAEFAAAREHHAALGHTWILDMPLVCAEELLGCLGLAFSRSVPPSPAQILQCEAIAAFVSFALLLSRRAGARVNEAVMQERERSARQRLQEVSELNALLQRGVQKFADPLTPEPLVTDVLRDISRRLTAMTVMYFEHREADASIALKYCVREGQSVDFMHDPRFAHFYGQLPDTELLDLARRFVAGDWESSRIAPTHNDCPIARWNQRMGHTARVVIPVQQHPGVAGFLVLCFGNATMLSAAGLPVARRLAEQLSVALQMERLNAEARRTAALDERSRIACEIHDSMAQSFIGILMQLEAATLASNQQMDVQQYVRRAKQLAADGLLEARHSISALRPPVFAGGDIITALRSLARKATASGAGRCTFEGPTDAFVLTGSREECIYRIAAEALHNALRHSRASEVSIALDGDADCIVLEITDNGTGIAEEVIASAPRSDGGLRTMLDRARANGGDLVIRRRESGGTYIRANFPRRTKTQ